MARSSKHSWFRTLFLLGCGFGVAWCCYHPSDAKSAAHQTSQTTQKVIGGVGAALAKP